MLIRYILSRTSPTIIVGQGMLERSLRMMKCWFFQIRGKGDIDCFNKDDLLGRLDVRMLPTDFARLSTGIVCYYIDAVGGSCLP